MDILFFQQILDLYKQWEISKVPSLYLLGRTVTFLNYLISSMYNCFIFQLQKLPEFQGNYIRPIPGGDAPPGQPRIVHRDQHRKCCEQLELFGNYTMELLGVIDLQNPKCIKRIKQNQLCYAWKSPTDKTGSHLNKISWRSDDIFSKYTMYVWKMLTLFPLISMESCTGC